MSNCCEGDQGPKHCVIVTTVIIAATDHQALQQQASETLSEALSSLGIRTLGGQVRGLAVCHGAASRSPENTLIGPFPGWEGLAEL